MEKAMLSHLAVEGKEFAVRVTPGGRRNAIETDDNSLRIWVTATPEGGKANAAVQKLLARALGEAKSRLVLVRGETSRDKVWRLTGL
jgi:uncharacterized protein YggU (UPF0235/DUF167 family)